MDSRAEKQDRALFKAFILAGALVAVICYATHGHACENDKLDRFRQDLRDDLRRLVCKVDQRRCVPPTNRATTS